MKKFFTTFLIIIFLAGGVCTVFGNQAFAMDSGNSDVVAHHDSDATDAENKVECCDCDNVLGAEMKCCYQSNNNTVVSNATNHQIRKDQGKSKIFVALTTEQAYEIHQVAPKVISLLKENYLSKRVMQRMVRLE